MSQFPVSVSGHLTADPLLVKLPSGKYKANLRVASSRRYSTQGENGSQIWADTDLLYIDVEAWEQLARNVRMSLRKGMPVMVTGFLNTTTWDDQEGKSRTRNVIRAYHVGFELGRHVIGVKRCEDLSEVAKMHMPDPADLEADLDYSGQDSADDAAGDTDQQDASADTQVDTGAGTASDTASDTRSDTEADTVADSRAAQGQRPGVPSIA